MAHSHKDDLDYSKFHLITVDIEIGLPSPLGLRSKNAISDGRWNPFNKHRGVEMLVAGKVQHKVKLDKLHLTMNEMISATNHLRDYYRRNPSALSKVDEFERIHEMHNHEVFYCINAWIGIVKHFGPKAHYRREFLAMMRPVPAILSRVGL